jgi:muramidase (phage lysozyme)
MEESGMGIKNPLWFIGVVENNVDERLEGRVQVRAFNVHGTVDQVPSDSLPWAIPISGSYDPNNPPPPLNSWVFGFFIDGRDAQQPMILGLIPTQMTETIDPQKNGWGRFPNSEPSYYDRLAFGSRARDFGQPLLSRLARGENIEETYVLGQEVNRIRNISSTEGNPTWEEPSAAYAAQYPFNRVTETASGHSIEIDDTPGAERIMIWHRSGSFLQIDSRGTKLDKTASDKYDVTKDNHHVYIGGRSIVTIEGDSHVIVKGNKTEEIFGDYRQMIHGNHELSVAGQLNLNSSEEIQARGAKIRIEANVENVNIKSAKNMNVESAKSIHIKSGISIFQEATNSINIKSGDDLLAQFGGVANIKSQSMYLTSSGALDIKGGHVKIGGGTKISLNASLVAVDDIIQLSSGQSVVPVQASNSNSAKSAESAELPEPTAKAIGSTAGSTGSSTGGGGGSYKNTSSIGSTGFSSQDDNDGSVGGGGGETSEFAPEALRSLLNLIAKAESEAAGGYNAYNRGTSGNKVLSANSKVDFSQMTIAELRRRQALPISNPDRIFAAGRYQIIPSTLTETLARTNISNSDKFSPDVQDALGIQLLVNGGLNRYKSGAITKEQFGNNIARIWAGLPVITGPKAGNSFYGGPNKSNVSISATLSAIDYIKNYTGSGGVMV